MSRVYQLGVVFLGLLLAAVIAEVSLAQSEEPTCEDRCVEVEDACLEACDEAADPEACEVACTQRADACLERCDS